MKTNLKSVADYELVSEYLKKHPKTSIGNACKTLKVPVSNFYGGKNRIKNVASKAKVKRKAELTYERIEASPLHEKQMTLVIGSPSQIAAMLREQFQ